MVLTHLAVNAEVHTSNKTIIDYFFSFPYNELLQGCMCMGVCSVIDNKGLV